MAALGVFLRQGNTFITSSTADDLKTNVTKRFFFCYLLQRKCHSSVVLISYQLKMAIVHITIEIVLTSCNLESWSLEQVHTSERQIHNTGVVIAKYSRDREQTGKMEYILSCSKFESVIHIFSNCPADIG